MSFGNAARVKIGITERIGVKAAVRKPAWSETTLRVIESAADAQKAPALDQAGEALADSRLLR
jgi:hypothetical protein